MWIFYAFYLFGAGAASGLGLAHVSSRAAAARLAAAERDLEYRHLLLDQLTAQRQRGAVLGTPTDEHPIVPPPSALDDAPRGRHAAPSEPRAAGRDPHNPPSLIGMDFKAALVELSQRQADRLADARAFYGMMRTLDAT